jgi:hypothetical protein
LEKEKSDYFTIYVATFTDWFLSERWSVFTVRYELNLELIQGNYRLETVNRTYTFNGDYERMNTKVKIVTRIKQNAVYE